MQTATKLYSNENLSASRKGFADTETSYILVFKTSILMREDVSAIAGWLNYHPDIIRWSVDRENIDHVLRVESGKNNPEEIIDLIKEAGYYCEELSY